MVLIQINFFIILKILSVTLSLVNGSESKKNSIDLTVDTFESEVSKKTYFVMFHAPWCGHCKSLSPIWEKLAEIHHSSIARPINIAKVDCTQHTSLCSKQEIISYPTLKLYTNGPNNGVKHRGKKDIQFLQQFLGLQIDGVVKDDASAVSSYTVQPVEFTDETFENSIELGQYFIKFFAPWCGHCKKLEPTWMALADHFADNADVVIGRLDCTSSRNLCKKFEVKGYPTLLWIENGKKIDQYSGARDLEDLKDFVDEKLDKDSSDIYTDEPSSQTFSSPGNDVVVTLTADNFKNGIERGWTFVKFFAPWCAHCKTLAPTYEELGRKFLPITDVTIAKIDCTLEINKNLCSEQKIMGFPTLVLYRNGKKSDTYHGDRSLDDLAEFIAIRVEKDEL